MQEIGEKETNAKLANIIKLATVKHRHIKTLKTNEQQRADRA